MNHQILDLKQSQLSSGLISSVFRHRESSPEKLRNVSEIMDWCVAELDPELFPTVLKVDF